MKKLLLPAVLALVFLNSSCDENESIQNHINEPTYGKDFTITGVNNNAGRTEDVFIEVSGRIHRPRRDCDYGLGLCNWSISINLREDSDYWHFTSSLTPSGAVRSTSSEEYHFDIVLDYPLDEEFDNNFYIDDAISSEEYSLMGGVYEIDMSMGEYGGYRIPVIRN